MGHLYLIKYLVPRGKCPDVLHRAQNSFLYSVVLLDSVILMSTSSLLHSSLNALYSAVEVSVPGGGWQVYTTAASQVLGCSDKLLALNGFV